MVKPIRRDIFFLNQKSEPATKADAQVVTDLLDTLRANQARCVGMAANMIGVRKRIIVVNMHMKGGNYHCYNVVGDCCFDLTSEQFGEEVLSYQDNPEQFRETHFAKEEKRLRYENLKKALQK